MTIKIEGYLTAEPCRDLALAKPGQLAIEGNNGSRQYTETIVEIGKVYKNGQIVLTGGEVRYNFRYHGSEDMRRVGKGTAWQHSYSLRPFRSGETVESFLAAQEASRQTKEAEAEAAANAKEAEHARRLAAVGGASLWEGRVTATYQLPGKPEQIEILIFVWPDGRGDLHVTHCWIREPWTDYDDRTVYDIELWDVDPRAAGKASIRAYDVRDGIERWITANYL
jgi:hypothetical protein